MTNCVKRSMNFNTNVATTIVISLCFMTSFFLYPGSKFFFCSFNEDQVLSEFDTECLLIADFNGLSLKTAFICGNEHFLMIRVFFKSNRLTKGENSEFENSLKCNHLSTCIAMT